MAVTATCAEVGVLGGQRSCLDPVDGIGVGILGGDGSAALALADKRTLAAAVSMPYSASSNVLRLHRRRTYGGFGLILARQFLHIGVFLFGRHKGGVSHAERGGATVLVLVLVLLLASVLVVKGGRKDRGADW